MNLKGIKTEIANYFKNTEMAIANFKNDETADAAKVVTDLTVVALVVALLLIPLGLDTLVNMTLSSNYSTAQTVAIGAITTVIIIAVILAILKKVQGGKGGR